jgi:C6 transcription factor Pro1
VDHYLRTVIKLQYYPADDMDLDDGYTFAYVIVHRLSPATLYYSLRTDLRSGAMALKSVKAKGRLKKLKEFFNNNKRELNADTEMASLNVIFSFLFDGGKGDLESWLEIACIYVETLIKQYGDPMQALQRCTKKDNFLVKITIWFDTLASITTLRGPRLLNVIRQLYSPLPRRRWR